MNNFKRLFKGFLAFALVCSVFTTLSTDVYAATYTQVATVDELVEAFATGGNYELADDISVVGKAIEVKNDVLLNLNGYTITAGNTLKTNIFVGQDATLTLQDTSENQTGKIISTTVGDYGIISVGGSNSGCAKFIMNSGSIVVDEGYGVLAGNSTSEITINGGTITTSYSTVGSTASGAKITIAGGTLTTQCSSIIYSVDNGTTIEITGGIFNEDVSAYVVDDYTLIDNEDGTYTVYSKRSLAISYAEELINGIDGVLEAGISEEDAIAEMTVLLEEVAEKIDSNYVTFSYRFYEYVASTVNEEGYCTFDYSVVFGSMGTGGSIVMAIEKLAETTTDTDATVTPSIDTAVSTDETTTELAPTIESSTLVSIFTKAELEGDEAISVNLDVKEIAKEDLSEEEISVIEEALASLENTMVHAVVLDLTLDKVVGTTVTNITELTDAIRITINIPEEFLGLSEEYVIVRVHEGVATILEDLDDDEKTITFETDCFSTYSIAYADTSVDATVTPDTTVDTGDTTNVVTLLSLLLLSAAGLLVIRKRA